MLHGKYAVTILRPATVVFDHIADGTRNAAWRGPVIEVAVLAGDGREGTVWHQMLRGSGGRVAEADYRVTVFERPQTFGFELIAGPVRGDGAYTLVEPVAGETTLTLALNLRPSGILPGLTGLARRQMATELDALDRLRNLLSSRTR